MITQIKNRLHRLGRVFFITLLFIVGTGAALSFAAMDDVTASDSDTVLNAIVQERIKAKQEYQQYKLMQKAEEKKLIQPKPDIISRKQTASSGKKDVLIGVVLVAIALALTAYLQWSSKQKRKE